MAYLWLKALHVVAAVMFAGGVLSTTLMLSVRRDIATDGFERLRIWHRQITTVAMLAVWGLGLLLAREGGWWMQGWLQAKLALVAALTVIHAVQSGVLRRPADGSSGTPGTPGLKTLPILALVAAIVMLAVVKPG